MILHLSSLCMCLHANFFCHSTSTLQTLSFFARVPILIGLSLAASRRMGVEIHWWPSVDIFSSLFLLHILRSFPFWCYLQFLRTHRWPSLCTHPHASCFLVLLSQISSIFQFYSILFLNFNLTSLFCLHHHSFFLLLQLHALKPTHFKSLVIIQVHPFLTTSVNRSLVLIPAPSFVTARVTERLC